MTVSSSARIGAFRGKKYGQGSVDMSWDDCEPTTVRITFVSSELGTVFKTRITREDLACACTGTKVRTQAYGMLLAGDLLYVGWKPNDEPCCCQIPLDIALFVLDGSEREIASGSAEEQAIIDAAVEELLEHAKDWGL